MKAASTVRNCTTVILSLIPRLQPRDEQKPCIDQGIFGARDVAGDPREMLSLSITSADAREGFLAAAEIRLRKKSPHCSR